MLEIALNILMTSIILSFVIWLSKSNPVLGGFIVSLPISTLIVLFIAKIQHDDPGRAVVLAKSIFIAVPSTLVFFIPFLVADKLKLSFWTSYALGFGLLSISYFIHRWIMAKWIL